ncbi:hypothetical protein BUALT_Bualt11G0062400 [Buddleja alternifolia]|uniref:Bet v I/Major latex protein domain-containing protein n=1 Tax=Buddleja alternifolia TaxID=168488 RepID=A0AAV6WRY4_9LAMI|nr:hypothetical protein BUALT_Bualt11G0062400 [Buddleja alternifolia]
MAQIAKIEAKAEIKCDPAKLYDFFKYNMTQFVNLAPHIFKGAQLVEGEEGHVGNVKLFEYVLGIIPMTVKVKTEAINDEERSITFKALEGNLMQLYSSFGSKVTFTDGFIKWCIEFEKANDLAPNPDIYAILAVEISKGLDAYLLNH